MNSAEMADHFINRAKNLQEYVVDVNVPEDFRFNGLVPFDMEIKENVIYAKVFAIDFNEAVQRLDAYLETCK